MRDLNIPRIRTLAYVTLQKEIHAVNHILNLSARCKFKRQIIKSALHIICGSQCSLTHPHHSETLGVGENHPGRCLVDKFWREHNRADGYCPPPPVDNGRELITRFKVMRC